MQYVAETPRNYRIMFNTVCFIYSIFVLSLYITIVWVHSQKYGTG